MTRPLDSLTPADRALVTVAVAQFVVDAASVGSLAVSAAGREAALDSLARVVLAELGTPVSVWNAASLPDVPPCEKWDWCAESREVMIRDRWGGRQVAVLRVMPEDDEPPRRDWRLIGRDGYTLELADVIEWTELPA